MDVKLTLQPGDRGTKKLLAEFGDKLVCVRYRYDKELRKRFKTVEVIVEEISWKPPPPKNTIVSLKVKVTEKELHLLIRNAGGRWDKDKKLWRMPYGMAAGLGLKERIVASGD